MRVGRFVCFCFMFSSNQRYCKKQLFTAIVFYVFRRRCFFLFVACLEDKEKDGSLFSVLEVAVAISGPGASLNLPALGVHFRTSGAP